MKIEIAKFPECERSWAKNRLVKRHECPNQKIQINLPYK